MEERSWKNRWQWPLFSIGGVICLLAAAGFGINSALFIRSAMRTTGVVVELIANVDEREHSTTYSPVFTFRDVAGVAHTVKASFSSSPPMYQVGESVPVLYQADNPERARIDGFLQHWMGSLVLGFLGVALILVGYFHFYRRQKLLAETSLLAK